MLRSRPFPRTLLVALLLLLPLLRPASGATPTPPAGGSVLVVGTDDSVVRPILARLSGVTSASRGVWLVWSGQLGSRPVAVTRSEGDPLNAVAATVLAIRRHAPALVLILGASRPHDPALRPGDVVVSERFAPFDGMISPVAALEAGSDALAWKKRPHLLLAPGEREVSTEFFPADPAALRRALALSLPGMRLVAGTLGSAHQVNREVDRIAWLRTHWQTSAEDGESAHIAGAAALLGVPALGLRVIAGTGAQAAAAGLAFLEAAP